MDNNKELEYKRKIESVLYPNEAVHKLGEEPITYYADILDTVGFEPMEFNSYEELYLSQFSQRQISEDKEVFAEVESHVTEFQRIDISTLSKERKYEQDGSEFIIYSTLKVDIANAIRNENEKECWASHSNCVDMSSLWEKIESIKNDYLWYCDLSDSENAYVDSQISDLFNKTVDECIEDNKNLVDRVLEEIQEKEEMEMI